MHTVSENHITLHTYRLSLNCAFAVSICAVSVRVCERERVCLCHRRRCRQSTRKRKEDRVKIERKQRCPVTVTGSDLHSFLFLFLFGCSLHNLGCSDYIQFFFHSLIRFNIFSVHFDGVIVSLVCICARDITSNIFLKPKIITIITLKIYIIEKKNITFQCELIKLFVGFFLSRSFVFRLRRGYMFVFFGVWLRRLLTVTNIYFIRGKQCLNIVLLYFVMCFSMQRNSCNGPYNRKGRDTRPNTERLEKKTIFDCFIITW